MTLDTKLSRVITLKDIDNAPDYSNGCFYRTIVEGRAPLQGIGLDIQRGTTIKTLLELFSEETCLYIPICYSNPTLSVYVESASEGVLEVLDAESINQDLGKLMNKINNCDQEYLVHNFRLGNNWGPLEGERRTADTYDTVVIFSSDNDSEILVTPRTKTEHLIPFIDARVEDGVLTVYDNGLPYVVEKL
jgi:hypothetical protein